MEVDNHTEDSCTRFSFEGIESLFKWEPHIFNPFETSEDVVSRLLEKQEEIVLESDFPWRSFIIKLVISYELYRQDNLKESIENINECISILKDCELCIDYIYKRITKALWHVALGLKAFLLQESKLSREAEKILKMITPIEQMDVPNKAGIYGIKSAVLLEYTFNASEEALLTAKEAVKLDPDQPEWHFLCGKSCGTRRRVYMVFEGLDDFEKRELQQAVQLATVKSFKNLRYLLYFGNMFREYGFEIFKTNIQQPTFFHSNLYDIHLSLNTKARNTYKTVLKLQKDDPRIMARCCFGLLKLPTREVDFELIKFNIEKAVSIASSNKMVLHVYGRYLEYTEDYKNALKYYKLSSCYGACMNFIKLNYRLSKEKIELQKKENKKIDYNELYNPLDDYMELLENFKSTPRRQETLCQIASYYLFQKKDIMNAINYCKQVFMENINAYHLKKFRPNFLIVFEPIDLMKIIVKEANYILSTSTRSINLTGEDKKKLRCFIILIGSKDATVLPKDQNVYSPVKQILDKYHWLLKKISKRVHKRKIKKAKKQQQPVNFGKLTDFPDKVSDQIKALKLRRNQFWKPQKETEPQISSSYDNFKDKFFKLNNLLKRSKSLDSFNPVKKCKVDFEEELYNKSLASSNDSLYSLPWISEKGEEARGDKSKKKHSNLTLKWREKEEDLNKLTLDRRSSSCDKIDLKFDSKPKKSIDDCKSNEKNSHLKLKWRNKIEEPNKNIFDQRLSKNETNNLKSESNRISKSNSEVDYEMELVNKFSNHRIKESSFPWVKKEKRSDSEKRSRSYSISSCQVNEVTKQFSRTNFFDEDKRTYKVEVQKVELSPSKHIKGIDPVRWRSCNAIYEVNNLTEHFEKTKFFKGNDPGKIKKSFTKPESESKPIQSMGKLNLKTCLLEPIFKSNVQNKNIKEETIRNAGRGSLSSCPQETTKWKSSRMTSENKKVIGLISSPKIVLQTVIRQPYGPEEGKRGFEKKRTS
uniref:Uncharacterized protein n=1 Tax=Clastoptera arizonana TaxID=38151 RepID=A0A1B6DN35_9HEMI